MILFLFFISYYFLAGWLWLTCRHRPSEPPFVCPYILQPRQPHREPGSQFGNWHKAAMAAAAAAIDWRSNRNQAMIATFNLSLSDERIVYEAIWRHVDHLAQLDWGSSDSIAAARIAVEAFPTLGYPIPGWVSELAQFKR